MWGLAKKRSNTAIDTLIGKNSEVTGDLHFSGGLHVEGRVKGNVIAEDGSDSVVTLAEQGSIEGEVRAPHVVLDGTVTGDVHASERVELAARARVSGNVYYNLIEMAIGAEVNGNLVHRAGHSRPRLAVDAERSARSEPTAAEPTLGPRPAGENN